MYMLYNTVLHITLITIFTASKLGVLLTQRIQHDSVHNMQDFLHWVGPLLGHHGQSQVHSSYKVF